MANSFNELFGLGSHSVDASLESWWKLQETTGTTAADDSGNSRDGTISGMGSNPTTADGPSDWIPSAMRFDGSDDVVSLTLPAALTNEDYTFGCYVKILSNGRSDFLGSWGNSAALRRFLLTWDITSNRFSHFVQGSSAVNSAAYSENEWHSVIAACDSGGTSNIVIDGSSEASTSAGIPLTRDDTFRIGASGDDFANADIAWAFVFSRKLTSDEWLQFGNGVSTGGPEPLVDVAGTFDTFTATTWTGTAPTYNSQSNGTITVAWELRLDADDSVVESGSTTSGGSIGASGTYSGDHYLWFRGSNAGGHDPAEDSQTAALSPSGAAIPSGTGSITTISSLSGIGQSIRSGTGLIASESSLTGIGESVRSGTGAIAAETTISGIGSKPSGGTGSIEAISSLSGIGESIRSGTGSIAGISRLSGIGETTGVIPSGTGSISGLTRLSGIGESIRSGSGTITAVASLSGIGEAPGPPPEPSGKATIVGGQRITGWPQSRIRRGRVGAF